MTKHRGFLDAAGRVFAGIVVPCAMLITCPASAQSGDLPAGSSNDARFLKESDGAMNRMMTGMAAKPSGDVDRDFVNMMVAHHQGAIDMAIAVLRYGHNEQIRRLAQEIIVDQQQEIAAMRKAVGDRLPASTAAPTMPSDASRK
jgi:hypothetical protein